MILSAGSEQGFGFPKGDRGQVPRGTQGTAPESRFFPPILPRQGRDTPPGRRIFRYSFHPCDWEKNQKIAECSTWNRDIFASALLTFLLKFVG
ncbi:MAG: hypothetical protein AMJ94_14445 [Deltaproteobacteria bacterium SM23_61]|nr:MAG: hypothetical protein AMJ94_14445 [Deltaproteobacteria bacterium SM23_61]